ncbi:MAG: hypothetical protein GWN27_04475 [candidate division Zixibacteria bacterium]|nr:hypothetical protein [candidate division Zixibacteria bacterium]
MRERIEDFHSSHPLRIGITKEEVRTKLRIDPEVFERIIGELVASGEYLDNGLQLMNVHHEIEYSDAQKKSIQKLMTTFENADYQPPSVKECIEIVGEDVYQSLLEQAEFRQVSQDVVFREAEYQEIVDGVRRIIHVDGGVTVGQVRDEFNTSRKYVLAVLEYMDSQGITKRVGDIRKLRSSTSS